MGGWTYGTDNRGDGMQDCLTCGKHCYLFLHSCPGVPQKPWPERISKRAGS